MMAADILRHRRGGRFGCDVFSGCGLFGKETVVERDGGPVLCEWWLHETIASIALLLPVSGRQSSRTETVLHSWP